MANEETQERKAFMEICLFNRFGLVGYGISAIIGYFMTSQFYTYKEFYFKQFSLE